MVFGNLPVSSLIKASANLPNNSNGNFIEAIFLDVAGSSVVSIQDSMFYCVNVVVVYSLALLLVGGVSSSSWVV